MAGRIHENSARNHYAACSLGAARAERHADYQHAASLWGKLLMSPAVHPPAVGQSGAASFVRTPLQKAGENRMKAQQFNQRYPVGQGFIYQPNQFLRGGQVVRTIEQAQDLTHMTVVEISTEPYLVRIEHLTPA
ncbi:hypothetical protein XNC1_3362 [Xenorhabdus nematophila ATCC 19061]|uniref:Uncharacterized protein n=2 Tax=Xenorhabdus nematophila TaxID=628 RepID=D3V960_XENNA|nr:hypothetical protein [Xenorhabdus nematophila]CBJ91410.1 hypothetical protein XNC1_3362 [Xenorhabdus nematophila ATCC 19061]CEK24231.1 hypothetical protein XNC2_3237 [Xenorhabdus nematophila AN6/1]